MDGDSTGGDETVMNTEKYKELAALEESAGSPLAVNGAGIELAKLNQSPGRPKGARNLHAKHPSSLARRFKAAGLDWASAFAEAIKAAKNPDISSAARRQAREDVRMWLKLLPYMVTQTNKTVKVRRWKGRASKAALVALDALEGR
jgi:hypothetical protein